VAFSPQANYTDRAKLVPTFADGGVAWSAQRITTTVNLGFLDRTSYFSIQVAPQLSSRGWVDPVPDPLLRKSGSAGNRTRNLWICSQELWALDHRGGRNIHGWAEKKENTKALTEKYVSAPHLEAGTSRVETKRADFGLTFG
jgi:hypothetical protein